MTRLPPSLCWPAIRFAMTTDDLPARPLLTDIQVAAFFEQAGVAISAEMVQRVTNDALDLEACADRLRHFNRGDLASHLGKP